MQQLAGAGEQQLLVQQQQQQLAGAREQQKQCRQLLLPLLVVERQCGGLPAAVCGTRQQAGDKLEKDGTSRFTAAVLGGEHLK